MKQRRNFLFEKGRIFCVFYMMLYMITASSSVMSVYLKSIGLTATQIGQTVAAGAVMTLAAQPVWGYAGDHAKTKMGMLQKVLIGMALASVLMMITKSFAAVLILLSAFYFFQIALNPTTDAVAIEYMDRVGGKYSVARAFGPIGYGITTIVIGRLMDIDAGILLYALVIECAALFFMCFAMPKIRGGQSEAQIREKGARRMPMRLLFKNRELMVLLAAFALMQIANIFYHNFLTYFYDEVGGNSTLMGIGLAICSASEVPVFIFGDKLWKKVGSRGIYLISAAVMTVRHFGMSFVGSPYLIWVLDTMHGFCFAAASFAMSRYVGQAVRSELQTSGQLLIWGIGLGIAKVIAGLVGGTLIDWFGGVQPIYRLTGSICLAVFILFLIYTRIFSDPLKQDRERLQS